MTEYRHLGWAENEAARDYIKKSQRGGGTASLIGVVLVTAFFYAHQAWSTGFFTASFGSTEAFFLYGSILLGIIGPVARAITGRRNLARLPESVASVFWIIASLWLLIVFPFDFTHFSDVVPDFLRFIISWITNDIARVLIALGTAGGVVFVGVNAVLYRKVKTLLQS
jgi:hypothetical protein